MSICCFVCPDMVHRILRQPPIFPLSSTYMPCEISPPLKCGFEEENLKTCTQLEITSCSFCFCNSASSLQSHVKLHSFPKQKLTTMLGAETPHSPLSITQSLKSGLTTFVCKGQASPLLCPCLETPSLN